MNIVIDITGTGADMEGVGRYDGMAVFVEGAMPGEQVEARIIKRADKYARAQTVKVLKPSPARIRPRCPHFGRCGGCALMYAEYAETLKFKAAHICDSLKRIGHIDYIDDVFNGMHGMDVPFNYRNRVQFPAGGISGAPAIGFYGRASHNVVDLPDGCMLVDARINRAREIFAGWMRRYEIVPFDASTGRGLVRHAAFRMSRRGALMAVVVINGSELPRATELWEALKKCGCISLAINVNRNRRVDISGGEVFGREYRTLYGESTYIDTIGDCAFELSAPSFFQINPEMTEALYAHATDLMRLRDGDVLLDAYCGAGTIGIYALKRAGIRHGTLVGVESVAPAVENARRNAAINGLSDARYYCGACEDVIERIAQKGLCPDVAVVDPPRKGCDARLLDALGAAGKSGLRSIVYVSCNPATLARDVARLAGEGWRVISVDGFDMFPWTGHVETVILMSRKDT